MFSLRCFILISLVSLGFEEGHGANNNISGAFRLHQVVPDVVKTSPDNLLYVKYTKGEPNLGNELTPKDTAEQPTVSWDEDKDSFYTLVMLDVDAHPDRLHMGNVSVILWTPSKNVEDVAPWSVKYPDAPSRANPVRRNWLHWLVVNVPGRRVEQGTTLAAYNGPNPPQGTGPHRYVFLAYKQSDKMNFSEIFPESEKGKRANFNLDNFTSRYLLGNPVAGNFFQARPHSH